MHDRHWSSHSEDLRPSNLCRPLGLRAHANLTLDSPTQVDFLVHIDVCDRLAAVALSRLVGGSLGTVLLVIGDFGPLLVSSRPTLSGHHHPLFGRLAGRVASPRSLCGGDRAAQMTKPRLRMFPGWSFRVRVSPESVRCRRGNYQPRCRLLRRRHLRSRRHRRSCHRRIQCRQHPTMRRPVPPPR